MFTTLFLVSLVAGLSEPRLEGEPRLEEIAANVSKELWDVFSNRTGGGSTLLPATPTTVDGLAVAGDVAETISHHLSSVKAVLRETAARADGLYSKHRNQDCCSSACQYGTEFDERLCSMSCNSSSIQYISTGRWFGLETGENATHQCVVETWEPDQCSAVEAGMGMGESAVHIPRDMHEQDPAVLCFIQWTDELFSSSLNLSSLVISAIYIGSTTRLFRFTPPSDWSALNQCDRCPLTIEDTFELGQRPWYTNTVTGDKFLLILLDVSGSMAGFQSTLARTTISRLLKALTSNDYFLVIQVGEGHRTRSVGCFTNKTRATPENVLVMSEVIMTLQDTNNRGRALFATPLEEALELLGNSMECHRVLIIFTDGDAETAIPRDIIRHHNPGLEIQVFTFLVGYGGDSANLKEVACNNRGMIGRIREYSDVIPAVLLITDSLKLNQLPNSTHVHYTAYRSIYGDLALTMGLSLWTNASDGEREAFGIAAVDIDHKQLLSSALQQHRIGASGYAFIVDNNGQLLSHPSISLDYIQGLSDDSLLTLDMDWYEHARDSAHWEELREEILSGGCGQGTIETWTSVEREELYVLRNTTYSYAPINGTPYMVVIVTPADLWLVVEEEQTLSSDCHNFTLFSPLGGRGQCRGGCDQCEGLQVVEGELHAPGTLTVMATGGGCHGNSSVLLMRTLSTDLRPHHVVGVAGTVVEMSQLLSAYEGEREGEMYLIDEMANIVAASPHDQVGWFPALYPDLQSDLVEKGLFEEGVVRGYEVRPGGGRECECEHTSLTVCEVNTYQRAAEEINYSTMNYSAVSVPNTTLTLIAVLGPDLHGNRTECTDRPIRLHCLPCVCRSHDKYRMSRDTCQLHTHNLCSAPRTHPLPAVVMAASTLVLFFHQF